MDDRAFMDRALFLAERGRGRTTPNPMVGAVVVSSDGVVVGQGAHLVAGGPHAEVHALDAAGDRAKGATLYVTLEPCCHTGRTGPCVERIVAAGIARVVIAVRDPNPRVSGGGVAYLQAHHVAVTEGIRQADAVRQHAPFFTWIRERRPFVTMKMAVSSDGFVGRTDRRVLLSGPESHRWSHRQRAEVDAIVVGADTVIIDNPLLTARGAYRFRPLTRVIVDWRMRVAADAAVWSTREAGPVIMVTAREAAAAHGTAVADLERRGVTVRAQEARDLRSMLEWLATQDIVHALVEGGPTLASALAQAGLVDRTQWILTPERMTEGVPWATGGSQGLWVDRPPRVTKLGRDTLLEFDVHGAD